MEAERNPVATLSDQPTPLYMDADDLLVPTDNEHVLKWVVPVEPDQDSAIIALLSPATVKAIGVSMSYNQAKKVVRVVLVGAGIGGDDGVR